VIVDLLSTSPPVFLLSPGIPGGTSFSHSALKKEAKTKYGINIACYKNGF
jgi:hypothetical protein